MKSIVFPPPRPLARFVDDRRGVSAVEFALLLPLMITLYLGGVEISQGVSIDRKVTLTSAALANLSAQVSTQTNGVVTISASDMTNILDASAAIIAPYSTTPLKMTISCLNIDANKIVTVKWSVTRNGTVQSGTVAIPDALTATPGQLIYSTVSYDYKPIIGYTITGTLTLSDKMYMAPRIQAPSYNGIACT